MTHVLGRRSSLLAFTGWAAAVCAAAGIWAAAAAADTVSPQPTNPSASTDTAGWHRLSGEGSLYRFTDGAPSAPGAFAAARGSIGTEVTVATCFDAGSYVIPGATYRARFFLQNWNGYGRDLRYEVRRGLGSTFATLLPSTPMAAGEAFVEILSPTFATGHGDRPCISFTGGAWPNGGPWDSFALDDVRLDVVSYPVPVAESPPALTASGAIRDGESVTHVPATWSIRAPYPVTRTAVFQRCNATGGACVTIGSSPMGSSHLLTAADVGSTVRVLETAVNAEGESQSTLSPATAVVVAAPKPEPSSPPTVRPGSGNTLVAGVDWPAGTNPTYQWFRCEADRTACTAIPGATSTIYSLTAADAGKYVFVRTTAATSGGTTTLETGYTVPSLSGAFPPVPVGSTPPVAAPPSAPVARGGVVRATLSASVSRTRVVAGAPVVVSGTLAGVAAGTPVTLTLPNAQWRRHARRYVTRTDARGRFRAVVRPVVNAEVRVTYAGTTAVPGVAFVTRRISVTPTIRVRITAVADGPGQVRNLRIRGRFFPGFGRGARLQLEGRPAGSRTWYSFCTRITVGAGGSVKGACNVSRLHTTNRYRLVYVAQAGSPWTTAASTATRARIVR